MSYLGRTLVLFGLLLIVIGGAIILLARFNVPLGRLPGDLSWRGRNWTVSIPIATLLLLSVLLTLLLWVIGRFRR